MGVCISLLPSFVLLEHLVLFFHIYTFILLFTDQKKKKNFLLVIMMIPIWKISALIFRVCSGPESGD